MVLKSPELFRNSFVNYGPLEQACKELGTTLFFTDGDMLHERHSRWLFIEWKGPGVKLNRGQAIAFEHLTSTGFFDIVVAWGDGNAGTPSAYQVLGQMAEPAPCGLDTLARLCVDWERWATAEPWPQTTHEGGGTTTHVDASWRWQG